MTSRTNPSLLDTYVAVGVAVLKACEDLGINGEDANAIAKQTVKRLQDPDLKAGDSSAG